MKVILGTILLLALSAEVRPTPTSKTNCECGRENARDNYKYSWMVVLEDKTKNPIEPFCSGAVITVRHILTAAHCLYDATKHVRLPANVEVVIGDYDLVETKDAHTQRLNVEKFIIHETYTLEKKLNDIALLETKTRIAYNDFVGPVCMPTVPLKEFLIRKPVKGMGWGLSVDKTKKLRGIDLVVWKHPGINQISTYRKTAKDICVADHGSPVVWMNPDTQKYTQVGLVGEDEDADECGTAEEVGTSTDVTAHVCWIEKQILPWRGEANTCHEI